TPPRPRATASPAQLEALYAAASSGDLPLLQSILKKAGEVENVDMFAMANDATSRTGLTALHAAASRGHLEIVQWRNPIGLYRLTLMSPVMEQCGAMSDLEDKEGETALHKAALHGHLNVIKYLVSQKANVLAQDADGWTALHNACSKGYLDIVRWLCEQGGACTSVEGTPGVDLRSKGGWTPLMNAASKGHLPVVLYLLTKRSANPLVRNNWGETAYDAAAAVFEVWICEVLSRFEADRWHNANVSYDPLAVHTTVPLILHENQRLDNRLKTLAVNGGRPRFSASGLGRHGRRPPFELKLPWLQGQKSIPAWRSDVQLPLREEPLTLPIPGSKDHPPREGAERSHFWLSDWTLDVTHPNVDAETGWQYAHSFDDPDDEWTPEPPPQLERLLTGGTTIAAGLTASGSSGRTRSRSNSAQSQSWVRRRRWVRVMRRRLDIPPLPFLEPDGNMYHWLPDGTMVPFAETIEDFHDTSGGGGGDGEEGQELAVIPNIPFSSSQDYVSRARYLAGVNDDETEVNVEGDSALEARRAIAKLERATMELRHGIAGDDDLERRTHAEVLLHAYSRELDRRKSAADSKGLLIAGDDGATVDDDDDDDDEFHYPGASPTETTFRPPSIRSYATDYFSRPSSSRTPADLTPHLAQAPEFRVPTHEAPQKVIAPRYTTPTPHEVHARWERDDHAHECRQCQRRFTFILRRHCRRCGRIFCDRCSSYRVLLDPSDIVTDPALPETTATTSSQRVCQSCYEEVNVSVPSRFRELRPTSMERIFLDQDRLSVPSLSRESSSQLSDLADCPVCNQNLADLGSASAQEAHVKNCLEGGTGKTPQTSRYLVYRLPGESTLIGTECVICLEEFVEGSMVARLSCLCSFHNACLSSWLQRGKSCPVHARDP
ncbi:ankyrin, partial [Dentipellis sp. KUC8613]